MVQGNLDRLEKQGGRNFLQLDKGRCHVPHLGRNSSRHQYTLRTDRLERRP